MSNLPPGVSTGNIPGNRSEDLEWEAVHEHVDTVGAEHGYDAKDMRLILDLGASVITIIKKLGYNLYTNAEIEMIEQDARREGYDEGVNS